MPLIIITGILSILLNYIFYPKEAGISINLWTETVKRKQ